MCDGYWKCYFKLEYVIKGKSQMLTMVAFVMTVLVVL